MINSIVGFSLRQRAVVLALTGALVVWGLWSLSELPIDAVPDVTNNQVQVITRSPSLAPLEVEQLISAPLELATANIPGLVEQRSISRYGLSVVTLVFTDETDVYWARQQVQERLLQVREQIDPRLGSPELGPVSTGLGEIYQYVIRPETGTRSWTAMELRDVQDWIVRRGLLGTDGVADVASFGGQVREYQAQVDPDQLRARELTLQQVFDALSAGSGNSGGTYIERAGVAYFIRGIGQITRLDELAQTVITTRGGVPVLVRDVAQVAYAPAVRYGALSMNGEGEVVGGIVLMRKGANSSMVITAVKARLEKVRRTLPKGLVIEAYLDRDDLVSRTIQTVSTNLVEGGLIVIFVLVLVLGNLRAGLIVASVIPLSMLFAFGLMHAFGVSGNLMSLGAIDFGLIVDGAVIVVENVVRHLSEAVGARRRQGLTPGLSRSDMTDTVYVASKEIRQSAAFGEVIILIVYLPLLSLYGIEGKMISPMALTVCFAIVGALVLSMTYVPVMCSLVLSPRTEERPDQLSERLVHRIYTFYQPALEWALRRRTALLVGAVTLVAGAGFAFTRLGGEFLPKLDEGDYALEVRLPVGVSLAQSLTLSARMERELLERFPNEVKAVVSKIGSAEIPTDPMPIEANDMMVILHPPERWTAVHSKAELTDSIAAYLAQVPGVAISILQPIEMRFNELISGAKSDVVVKVFGPDLHTLATLGEQVGRIARQVPGAADIAVQRVEGQPQLQVIMDRARMAAYGVTVADVNSTLEMAYAGRRAGQVVTADRRYPISVRLDEVHRNNPDGVGQLLVPAHKGPPVPLHSIARIELVNGPAEIAREGTERRLHIGVNARGRDVQSMVEDLDARIGAELKLPTGYRVEYGGQFENLVRAQHRLAVVVPLALALIAVLLYVTFQSVVETLLIFVSIPLSAVGGVAALYVREMNFSVSAGVGFIALSGVAVLNGIVLVSYLNQLERQRPELDLIGRVRQAVAVRFRPVLITTLVASLGFLPMALSTSAGAEVQRPLATVVIGGLVTCTLLTLVVLPGAYVSVRHRFYGESIMLSSGDNA